MFEVRNRLDLLLFEGTPEARKSVLLSIENLMLSSSNSQIWFLHRRCCSINSKPFRFPDFSAKEAQSALEVLGRPRTRETEREVGADLKRVEVSSL